MWTPRGKNGEWIWYDQGNWPQAAKDAGLDYVLVKSGDGGRDFNGGQFNEALVFEAHNIGLSCMAWTYCYLDDPVAEAQNALQAIARGADGVILDVEYEAIGKANQAEVLVNTIKSGAPDTFVGYAPDFRIAFANNWPKFGFNPDPEPFAWATFNTLDGVFPQLYWTDFQQAPLLTLEMANQWARGCQARGWPLTDIYTVIPCTATEEDVTIFLNEANAQGFAGANLWRWNWGNHLACARALGRVQWNIATPEPEPEPTPPDSEAILRTYIGEMGSPDGSVVKAFDAQLAKKSPSRTELTNVRNRLVGLYHEALG